MGALVVGEAEGETDGNFVGDPVGEDVVGASVGDNVGEAVGEAVVGASVGDNVGDNVGETVGGLVTGASVGEDVSTMTMPDGPPSLSSVGDVTTAGAVVGAGTGACVSLKENLFGSKNHLPRPFASRSGFDMTG